MKANISRLLENLADMFYIEGDVFNRLKSSTAQEYVTRRKKTTKVYVKCQILSSKLKVITVVKLKFLLVTVLIHENYLYEGTFYKPSIKTFYIITIMNVRVNTVIIIIMMIIISMLIL